VNPSLKSKINLLIFLLIAVALMFFAFRGIDFEKIVIGFKNANYLWVILALLISTISHFVRALRWKLLIEPLGYKPSTLNTTGAILVGYLSNLVFPRLGEVTRCGTLRKTDKVPFESLFGTVIVERAFDVLVMFILLVAVFFIRLDFFGKFIWSNALIPIWEKIKNVFDHPPLLLIGLTILIFVTLFLVSRNLLGKKIGKKLKAVLHGLKEGIQSVFIMKKRVAFLGYTVLLWFLYWLMTWLIVFATEPTSNLGPIDGLFLLMVGSFGMAAPVQGGFGAFHIIVAMALGIFGISREDGLIYAIISHESQTLLMVVLGLVSLIYFFVISRKTKPSEEIT
jgi:glycosyltransferase 2 family protein